MSTTQWTVRRYVHVANLDKHACGISLVSRARPVRLRRRVWGKPPGFREQMECNYLIESCDLT